MLHAIKALQDLAVRLLEPEQQGAGKSQLEIPVILTSFKSTQAALERAGVLATRHGARITLIAVQVVPYPLPLDKPPVPLGYIIRRFEEILSQSLPKAEIRIFLCRDQMEALKRILTPYCPVVLGIRNKRWWSRESRLARGLRHAGHEVILVETE